MFTVDVRCWAKFQKVLDEECGEKLLEFHFHVPVAYCVITFAFSPTFEGLIVRGTGCAINLVNGARLFCVFPCQLLDGPEDLSHLVLC